MDVIPIVSKEVAARYHQRVACGGATASAESRPSEADRGAAAGVTPELATLLTRLRLLGSHKTDECGNVGETAERIEALVEELVSFLYSDCSTPNLAALMLQSQGQTMKSSIRNKRRTAEVKREALTVRLTDTIVDKANASPDEILGDVTLYILHRYGQLGPESDGSLPVHKETAAVLCSVLPRQQVLAFVHQDALEKQHQLEELRRIVWGIRIFNKEEAKTVGVGIEAVHSLVEGPLASIETQLVEECAALRERLHNTRAVLMSPTCPLKPDEARLLQEEYHHLLQVEHSLLLVRCMHATVSHRIHSYILPKYDGALTELRSLFAKGAAAAQQLQATDSAATGSSMGAPQPKVDPVPKKLVYPYFVELADAYECALNTVEEFEEIRSLLNLALSSARSYTTTLTASTAESAVQAQVPVAPLRDRAALAAATTARLETMAADGALGDFHMYYSAALPVAADAVVEEWFPRSLCGLRGFCPVHCVDTGLLVPGRVDVRDDPACPGFIVVEGGSGRSALARPMCLAFTDETALRTFAENPLAYFLPCIERANQREPGMSVLMGLLERLPRELYIEGARSFEDEDAAADWHRVGAAERESVSVGTQTGQIDSYVDHNYRWNEWDLRRQALKLANLINMRTHSSQTAASHYRRDNTTQVNPPKSVGMQTMQDAATQPPRVVQYLKGLRGTETSEVEQVRKTFLY